MLLGLMLSICFRRRPWAALIWVPTLVSFATVTWLILTVIFRLGGLRGPDAGWGVLEIMVLLPVLAVCMVGLTACYFCKPTERWNPRIFFTSIIIPAAALLFLRWSDESKITIQLADTKGQPVTDVSLSYNGAPRIVGSSNFEFPLRRQRSVELSIFPAFPNEENLTDWTLRFHSVRGDSSKLEISYSTSRKIAFEQSLIEAFTETVTFTGKTTIPLTLTPRDTIGPDPMRDKIRAAFKSIKSEPGRRGLDYGSVCRNLTALEFIPELVELARQGPDKQFSVLQGLKAIANTLSDLHDGCGELEKALAGVKSRPPAEVSKKVRALGVWAGVPGDGNPDDRELLAQVQQKILSFARPIVSFCLSPPPGMESPNILYELGRLNRPHLSDFVQRLLANPPDDMQSALAWSRVFFGMRATKTELQQLVDSNNPLLRAASRNALGE